MVTVVVTVAVGVAVSVGVGVLVSNHHQVVTVAVTVAVGVAVEVAMNVGVGVVVKNHHQTYCAAPLPGVTRMIDIKATHASAAPLRVRAVLNTDPPIALRTATRSRSA